MKHETKWVFYELSNLKFDLNFLIQTVKCHYNAVQYNMILHEPLQELRQNINQRLSFEKKPYTSPYWVSY